VERHRLVHRGEPQTSASLGSSGAFQTLVLSAPVARPGYDEVAADGGIFNHGGAGFYGALGSLTLNKPIVGMGA